MRKLLLVATFSLFALGAAFEVGKRVPQAPELDQKVRGVEPSDREVQGSTQTLENALGRPVARQRKARAITPHVEMREVDVQPGRPPLVARSEEDPTSAGCEGNSLRIARQITEHVHEADRGSRAQWVCSVCTGALLLGAAGLLRGYRASVHWGARDALSQFGAEVSDERVCIDRNRLTGGGITAGVDFGIALAGKWAGEGMGRVIELIMEYAPQPPYGSGRPELADAQTLAAARAAMQQAMTGAPA